MSGKERHRLQIRNRWTLPLSFDPVGWGTIKLSGIYLDSVSKTCTRPMLPNGRSTKDMVGHQRRWQKFYDLNSKPQTYNEGLDLHFWRLISDDCQYRITRPPDGEFMTDPLKLFHIWLGCIETSTKILQRSRADNANFVAAAACTGRQLFCTENGYVGTGPPDLEPGDLIYALAGGP